LLALSTLSLLAYLDIPAQTMQRENKEVSTEVDCRQNYYLWSAENF